MLFSLTARKQLAVCDQFHISFSLFLLQGCRLEAKDHLGDKWWEAKVVEMDQEGNEVLVHFTGKEK